jgi:hypothetical protein
MNKLFRTLTILLLVAGTACTTQAQQDDDKKIKIKITKKIDGETKSFEGEYANEEEMRSDPAYKEFAGDENEFTVFFDGEHDFERIIKRHGGSGNHAFSFSFDDEDGPMRHLKNFKFDQGGPNVFWLGDDDAHDMKGFNSEEFEKKLTEKMKELEEKMKGLDKSMQEDILKSIMDIEKMHSDMMMPHRMKRGGVSIEDAGDSFGKRGVVEAKDKLELDDVNFMIMNKRLNLRFKVKNEGEMSVKISNESGKEIYNRYFEKFSGTFNDNIDFSQYSSGKYLLEISQNKKRLTKKLVID